MAARRPRARQARRARGRLHTKLVRDLERLALLQAGGSPERPIGVGSPAEVEPRAEAHACPLCGGSLRLEEHAAAVAGGIRLRVARVACTACGTRRALYFRLDEWELH